MVFRPSYMCKARKCFASSQFTGGGDAVWRNNMICWLQLKFFKLRQYLLFAVEIV